MTEKAPLLALSTTLHPILTPSSNLNNMAPQSPQQPSEGFYEIEGAVEHESYEDATPEGGYGWVCVAACFTINCFTWGAVSVN
jgi:hypothetical protein